MVKNLVITDLSSECPPPRLKRVHTSSPPPPHSTDAEQDGGKGDWSSPYFDSLSEDKPGDLELWNP